MNALTSRLRAAALGAGTGRLCGLPAQPAQAGGRARSGIETSRHRRRDRARGRRAGRGPGGRGGGRGRRRAARRPLSPPGAILGAAGDSLGKSEAERARLHRRGAARRLARAGARPAPQLDQTLQRTDELGLDVSFRTDDDSVTVQAMSPLLKLGALAASMPQAQVRVAGYADPRGSDAWNNDAVAATRAERCGRADGVPACRASACSSRRTARAKRPAPPATSMPTRSSGA